MRITKIILLIIPAMLTLILLMPGCAQIATGGTYHMPKPFYGVNPVFESKLEQIVLGDPQVQNLIKDWDQTFTVAGNTIHDKGYSIAVGVRLKENFTSEEFREWQSGVRGESSLIAEYVGTLSLGNNDKYEITIDPVQQKISSVVLQTRTMTPVPYVTPEDRQRAVSIGIMDSTVSQILEGKSYEINGIGLWSNEGVKQGVGFNVRFDKTYAIDQEIITYKRKYRFTGEVTGLHIIVKLPENRVEEIFLAQVPPK